MIPRQNLTLPVGGGIFLRLVGTQLLKPKKVTFFLYAAITFPFCASPPSCKRKTLTTKWDPIYIFMYIYKVWCWKKPAARNPGCFGTKAVLKSTGALHSQLNGHLPKPCMKLYPRASPVSVSRLGDFTSGMAQPEKWSHSYQTDRQAFLPVECFTSSTRINTS